MRKSDKKDDPWNLIDRTSLDVQESALDVQESTLDVQESALDVQESALDVQESALDVQESTLDVQESTLDVQESTLDMQPSSEEATVCKSNGAAPHINSQIQVSSSQANDTIPKNSFKASYSSHNNMLFYAPIALAAAAITVGVGFALTRKFK